MPDNIFDNLFRLSQPIGGEIDLTDLMKGEAIRRLEKRVGYIRNNNMQELIVIVAQSQRLRAAVLQFAFMNHIRYQTDEHQPHRIRFEFEATRFGRWNAFCTPTLRKILLFACGLGVFLCLINATPWCISFALIFYVLCTLDCQFLDFPLLSVFKRKENE
jgi:hypothetical protein